MKRRLPRPSAATMARLRLPRRGGGTLRWLADAGPRGITLVALRRDGRGSAASWQEVLRREHPATDPGAALPALLAAAAEAGLPRPRRLAVMLAGAVPAVVDLPVDPQRPRAPTQMMEMARYEAEPAIAAHNAVWTIGAVLQARGVLDAAAREAVTTLSRQGRFAPNGDTLRFGELALELGCVAREALDAALQAQTTLQMLDRDIACGWHGALVRDGQGHRLPLWRVAATGAQARADWIAATRAAGLRLEGLWPRTGLAVAWGGADAGVCLGLELTPECVHALRRVDGACGGQRLDSREEQPADAESLATLLLDWQVEPLNELRLVVADPALDAAALAAGLQRLMRLPVTVVAADAAQAASARAQALAHELDSPAPRLVRIPAADPRPPLWRRPGWRPWLAAGASVAAAAAWQGWVWWDIHAIERQREAIEARLNARSADREQGQQQLRELQQRQREVAGLRQALQQTLARADAWSAVRERTLTVPALIRDLGAAIDAQVVLDGVREPGHGEPRIGLEVRAWSTEAPRLQAYAERVQQRVAGRGISVAQPALRSRAGRQGEPGVEMVFWLVPQAPELEADDAPAAASGVRP
ncbi:hypothetical protein [Rubrivivax gelatinosus]|uniref:hypothetical protein n=1 Tax=Rubrivivax gelatinosus TaxID=28068 RepID=UPI003A7F8347